MSGESQTVKMLQPRSYQLEILEYVTQRNAIIYLPTGSGKTFVAILALKRFSHEMQEPICRGGKRAIFMTNTIELARQQAVELRKYLNLSIGLYIGERSMQNWQRKRWEQELHENQVLVGTSQIFVDLVNHNYIKLSDLSIVIFDECHHATKAHPMHQFLSFFQDDLSRNEGVTLTRIVGLTGVLLMGNKLDNVEKKLKALEAAFRGNIVTVNTLEKLDTVMVYSTKPKEEILCFPDVEHRSDLEAVIKGIIEEAKGVVTGLSIGDLPQKSSKGLGSVKEHNKKLYLINCLNEFVYEMEEFGLYTASIAIMSIIIELEIKKRQTQLSALRYLYRIIITQCERIRHILMKFLLDVVDADDEGSMADNDKLKLIWSFSTPQLRELFYYMLTKFLGKQAEDINCLIFVERRFTAKCVYYVLKNFVEATTGLKNVIHPQFMVGRNFISSSIEGTLERKWNANAIKQFRNKECNLIVCSNVLEEGIDIQSCNFVFMLDPIKTFSSYLQSKGRARSTDSTYAIFTSKSKEEYTLSQVQKYKEIHEIIQKFLIDRRIDRDDPNDGEIAEQFIKKIHPFVTPSGATLNAESALQLISRYCASLPSDSYGYNSAWYSKVPSDDENKICVEIKLPLQSTLKESIISEPMENTKLAKISAAFKACVKLFENGELNERLLPITKRECLANVSDLFFKQWQKHLSDDNVTLTGTNKHFRLYEKMCPDQMYNSMPEVLKKCYVYEILIVPQFEMDGDNEHLLTLFNSSNSYALVIRKPLPLLAEFPLFITEGMLRVRIVSKPMKLIITTERLNKLKSHHIMVFRDILNIWKPFFVVDQRNEQNSYLLAPLKNGKIDWKVINEFQRLPPIRKYTKTERAAMHLNPADWIGQIVNTWYSVNESERYLVTKVVETENPRSYDNCKFERYVDIVKEKYNEDVVQINQFMIEVKSLTTCRNFLINAKAKNEININSRFRTRKILIPEMCHKFLYPSDLWLKALFLPCILHRLNFMLHAEAIRVRINTYLDINDTAYQPKPLMIETSIKRVRVICGDANIKDTNEKPQNLVSSLSTATVHPDFENRTRTECEEYMEPINLQRNENILFPLDIQYYYKYVSNTLNDIQNFEIEDFEAEYKSKQCEMPMPKPKVNKNLNDSAHLNSITGAPLEDRRRILILERTFAMLSGQLADSAEQGEFVAALTTASTNDAFDMESFEVLGDSFLNLSISLFLMHKFPKWHEGNLTEVKSKFLSNRNLLYCMLECDLPNLICASEFKPNDKWLPPIVSIPNNILYLINLDKTIIQHILPKDLYTLDLSDNEIDNGNCSDHQLDCFVNSCIQHQFHSKNVSMNTANDVHSFVYKEMINDKCIADTLKSILGVCVKNYGIHQSFRMLNFFDICNEISEGVPLTNLLELDLASPLLRTNITTKEIDGFLVNYEHLEKNLGYNFRDRAYLLQALTHQSYSTNRITGCYQEFVFIGDAILDFLVSCYLFERCQTMNPDKLTDLRSALVNNITLGCVCVRHRFHLFLLSENSLLAESIKNFAEYQETQDHRVSWEVRILMEEGDCKTDLPYNMAAKIDVPKALGNIVNALIAAVYLDSRDLQKTWNVIFHLLEQEISDFLYDIPIDPVRQLNEYKGADPKFSNPMMDKEVIMVTCSFTHLNRRIETNGFGPNKAHAKKSAAKHALKILTRGYTRR